MISLPAADTQHRIAKTVANLLLAGLVIYLGIVMANATWLFAWKDKPVAVAPVAGVPGHAAFGNAGSWPLASYDFFGRPKAQGVVAEAVKRSAPETGLKLRLEGVLVGQRPEGSGAIVAGSNGETAWYRVGDLLPGNAELAEVESGRILIRRGGRYEALTFEDGDISTMVAEVAREPAESSPEAFLESARQQLDSAGIAALTPYGLSPVDDTGSSGYVYNGTNAMLNAVNLQAGDVITAINGQRLGNVEQDRSLLESWRGQASLEIEIERDGSFLTISYAIPEQWR